MTIEELKELLKSKSTKPNFNTPKILIFDVEIAPMMAYVWRRWKQNISLNQTISEWFMLCWSAKWLYSNEILGECLTTEEANNMNDYRIVKKLRDLINEADIVVAYNGKKADIPWLNSRIIIHNINPPKPYLLVDPLITAKQYFGFSSNKLDALASYFGFDPKLETGGFDLWKKCMMGDKEALNHMLIYNKQDVKLLEEVYLKLRPWIKNHPNIANLTNKECCCTCGSTNFKLIKGKYYYTTVSKYNLYKCSDCNTIFRGRTNLNKKK